MVNEEHYAWLKKGVQAWNKWRDDNRGIIPDFFGVALTGANLSRANLSRANLMMTMLCDADFSNANLQGANLIEAYLQGANLQGANLQGANLQRCKLVGANLSDANLYRLDLSKLDLRGLDLSGANLSEANLSEANLNEANLSEADLSNADLSGANLSYADLMMANLSGANLNGANLCEVDLNDANLSGVNLSEAYLSEADLRFAEVSEADLSKADFSGANLSEANLNGVNLSGANLSSIQALGTDFTGAKFTGVCLEYWHTNSATKLNDIDCQYVYLKSDKQERRPSTSSREFAPGEFTKLFQIALETVDLIFADGIDWKAFLLSFQELQDEYGQEKLSVQAFEKKSGNAFVVRLEVLPETNKAEIECRIIELYEVKLNALEGIYRKELQAKDEQIIIYKEQSASIMSLAKEMAARPIQNIIDVKVTSKSKSMSESYQSKYDQRNSNNQFVDTAQTGSNSTFNQYNSSEQKKTLAETASEIQKLLKQLEETNPTATEPEKVTYINDETTPSFKRRVVGAFQAGGETAIDEFILENKYLKVTKAAIKGWLQPSS
ncbi:pentapeptide repeat-containing protein [Nostoc sp. UCD121]|uniref:pentapeptide repeat-containing protein n=1 Tax=unclassified Nostoc TaxID=2593658 RepID=UPI001624CE5D|nr:MULTISPECIES: pentapeptide repeat-containing protein [unclassified Nostoc]MBC1225264.1 pentapeptide repeat-containing protein [Nostoc sp. UCD120]MBC1280858.1 pentapeptide repeat-containing protein [Nostoc sp. UCD121]